jgi:CHAD domain-containing protein
MAFRLKAKESVSDGIRRNVRRQIEKAHKHLGAKRKRYPRGASENATVPKKVRKCFKKVRAALRLMREELGDDVYRQENWCFRDAARLLSDARDADMLVEIVGKLIPLQFAEAVESGAFAKIHEALLANREEGRRVLDEDRAFAALEEVAKCALARLPDWRIERDGWAALESGLRRAYRTGRRALALAAENSSVINLHEWRKQAKHLMYQLELLDAAWTGSEKELGDQTQKLAQLLGNVHDLAVLRETLAADPTAYGGHRILKGVFAVIDRRREDLERHAFTFGRKLYKDSPKVFTSRIEAYWKAWAAEIEAARPPTRTRPAQGRKGGDAQEHRGARFLGIGRLRWRVST